FYRRSLFFQLLCRLSARRRRQRKLSRGKKLCEQGMSGADLGLLFCQPAHEFPAPPLSHQVQQGGVPKRIFFLDPDQIVPTRVQQLLALGCDLCRGHQFVTVVQHLHAPVGSRQLPWVSLKAFATGARSGELYRESSPMALSITVWIPSMYTPARFLPA